VQHTCARLSKHSQSEYNVDDRILLGIYYIFTPQPLAARGIVMIKTGGRMGGVRRAAEEVLSAP